MSILNAWASPDEILVAADTQVVTNEGEINECSKLIVLPHINAVLGCRGVVLFYSIVAMQCVQLAGDFDRLAAELRTWLPRIFGRMVQELQACGRLDMAAIEGETILLAGWSTAARRMVARVWQQDTAAGGFIETEASPAYVSPFNEGLFDQEAPRTPELMEVLARKQARLLRDRVPGCAAGGRLVVGRVTQRAVTVSTVADLS